MKISILGAGGWGTALSLLLAKKDYKIILWEKFPEYEKVLKKRRENIKFLPGVHIPKKIKITSDFSLVSDSDVIVLAVPSHFLRSVLEGFKRAYKKKSVIVSAVKGLEENTLFRMSEVVYDCLGDVSVSVISGPSHAEEVSRGVPTAVVVAGKNKSDTKLIQKLFAIPSFRIYVSHDVAGVEYGGALKNIIAIAAGIVDGLKLGDNTKAALVTRGLAEISRLGVKLGAKPITFLGLAGIGDMMVSCYSRYSRNRRVGEQLGSGKKIGTILKSMEMVAEGIKASKVTYNLSRQRNIAMPITQEVFKILFKDKPPREALCDLINRPQRTYEFDF